MWLSPLAILLAPLMAGQGLDVRSATDCPSSAAISGKLAPLLAGHGEAGDVAWVDVATPEPNQPGALRVRLVRAEANVIVDRHLPVQGGCDEMADTVATVLATWETTMAPPPTLLPEDNQARAEPAPETHHAELWLGASGGAGLWGGIVGAGSLELVLQHTGSHLLGRVAMTGQTTRQLDLGPGEVIWRRGYGALGLGWQARQPKPGSYWQMAMDVDVLLGWLTAEGRGFWPNSRKTVFEYGFAAGVRGQRRFAGWALWLEARANLWPAPERAILKGVDSSAQLDKFDVLLNLGVSLLTLR